MSVSGRARDRLVYPLLVLAAFALFPTPLRAQSLTAGALRGLVQSQDEVPVDGTSVTLEGVDGGLVLLLETDRNGTFAVPLLAPGRYRVLAEQVGFQPVRMSGIVVTAGQTASVTITMERRPPPITSVTEVEGQAAQTGSGLARIFLGSEVSSFDRDRAFTDVARGATGFLRSFDGRAGLGLAASGRPVRDSRLIVDGVPELLLRHPGLPDEPLAAESFQRGGIEQAQFIGAPVDVEWRSALGTVVAGHTRRGSNQVRFAPWAAASSARFGVPTELNPADSAATSFQVGASLSGAIVPDTAQFLLQATYQSLEMPSAAPWVMDTASYRGAAVPLGETLRSIASDTFKTSAARATAPVVRTWKGISGLGRIDWRLSPTQALFARVNAADWEETSPLLGESASNLAGTGLEARDIGGAFGLTSTGATAANEFRVGFSSAKRLWAGASLPPTVLVGEGAALGAAAGLAGLFDQRAFDISDAVQFTKGRHQLKLGGQVTFLRHEQDWRYGSAGRFHFGNLDRFGAAEGTYYLASGPAAPVQFNSTEAGLFIQDVWAAAPDIQLLFGVRYDTQILPTGRIALSQPWLTASGGRNDFTPRDRKGVSPRFGFVWDVQNRSEWVLRGGGGLYQGRLDPLTLSEVLSHDGDVTVRRGLGTFRAWPAAPSTIALLSSGTALTFFDSTYRAPRSFKAELGITRHVAGGLAIGVAGSYHHADYLLRRTDLNRAGAALATTSEGRPVYGALVQQGGLIAPRPGSNRRFDTFDMVYTLLPSGVADHYEVTASLERRRETGLTLLAAYTYSKTEDNVLGQRSADPADGLSPFPEGLNGGDWADGRSDFDVPHRVAATVEYRGRGRTPVTVGARFRYQSGLPFTPGFRPGVDVNGDGSGGNDPVALGASVSGLTSMLAARCTLGGGTFAARNSCREDARQALDLRFAVAIPLQGDRQRVALTVDAYNVVSTETGLIDRAALLVDPAGALPPPGTATIALPLVVNPRFGTLLSRRDDPRLVRIGLRIDY